VFSILHYAETNDEAYIINKFLIIKSSNKNKNFLAQLFNKPTISSIFSKLDNYFAQEEMCNFNYNYAYAFEIVDSFIN